MLFPLSSQRMKVQHRQSRPFRTTPRFHTGCSPNASGCSSLISRRMRQQLALKRWVLHGEKEETDHACGRRVQASQTPISLFRGGVLLPTLSEFFPIELKPTQYFFCLDDEELPALKHLWFLSSHGEFRRDFHRKYLRYHPDEQPDRLSSSQDATSIRTIKCICNTMQ